MKQLKILIIGKNSLTGSNLYFFLKKKYFTKIVSFEDKIINRLDEYDYIINCSINQKYIKYKYDEKNDFDLKIIKGIKGTKTKFIFLSTRKIYQSSPNIKENSKKKCVNNYEKNKYITEKKIITLHKNNSTILRISNLIGFQKINSRKVHQTYVDCLLKIISEGKIYENRKKFKDFLDINSFSKIIHLVIKNKIIGTYNVSIGEKIYLNEINRWILYYFKAKNKLKICHLNNKENDESFFLNNSKLFKKINFKINKQKLKKECIKLSKKLFK
jgi:dTDP-4-dehydrorhamnose reductase